MVLFVTIFTPTSFYLILMMRRKSSGRMMVYIFLVLDDNPSREVKDEGTSNVLH